VTFNPASRSRLTSYDLKYFQGTTLFDRIGRVLCEPCCVPRKELFESWEFAKRIQRRHRHQGGRVLDLACGHALVAHFLLLLDDTLESALAVDRRVPQSAARISEALVGTWPRLAGRIQIVEQEIEQVEVRADDLLVSAHACGGLTDEILSKAISASARVVVMPCCQSIGKNDRGGMDGWLDPDLAVDVTRAARLRAHGYAVHTQRIPESITPKNWLLFGDPRPTAA
jgi:hypothetical protein